LVGALRLLVGIVLSPHRTMAVTIRVLVAYDAAVGPTPTLRVEAAP
jgi:hypothetical protein